MAAALYSPLAPITHWINNVSEAISGGFTRNLEDEEEESSSPPHSGPPSHTRSIPRSEAAPKASSHGLALPSAQAVTPALYKLNHFDSPRFNWIIGEASCEVMPAARQQQQQTPALLRPLTRQQPSTAAGSASGSYQGHVLHPSVQAKAEAQTKAQAQAQAQSKAQTHAKVQAQAKSQRAVYPSSGNASSQAQPFGNSSSQVPSGLSLVASCLLVPTEAPTIAASFEGTWRKSDSKELTISTHRENVTEAIMMRYKDSALHIRSGSICGRVLTLSDVPTMTALLDGSLLDTFGQIWNKVQAPTPGPFEMFHGEWRKIFDVVADPSGKVDWQAPQGANPLTIAVDANCATGSGPGSNQTKVGSICGNVLKWSSAVGKSYMKCLPDGLLVDGYSAIWRREQR